MARPFCGREDELAALRQAYEAIENAPSAPKVVVLLGESGLGKTRLVQEFYHWLSTTKDRPDGEGYWPDVLSPTGSYRDVNPSQPCRAAAAPPYLWLGLPCREELEGLEAYAAKLRPHLEPLRRARAKRDWAVDIAEQAGGTAVSLIPVIGPLIKGGWDLFKDSRKFLKVWAAGSDDTPVEAFHDARHRGRQEATQALIDALADFLDAPLAATDAKGRLRQVERAVAGLERIPAVIAIDDAQWIARSPALLGFVERLLETATARRWPLLVIATHWEREWNEDRRADRPGFARAIAAWSRNSTTEPIIVQVRPQVGAIYDDVVQAALPGLEAQQREVVLARADGNARLLEEVLLFAQRTERLFEGRDPGRRFTDEGLAELASRQFDLHDLIATRLAAAKPATRAAAALSALQGRQFLGRFTVEVADKLGFAHADVGLRETIDPHAMAYALGDDAYAFAQGVYRDVAHADLANVGDAAGARRTLLKVVKARLADAEALASLSETERRQTRRIAAEILRGSRRPAERGLRMAVLLELAAEAGRAWDYVTVAALVKDVLDIADGAEHLPEGLSLLAFSGLCHDLASLGDFGTGRRLAELMWTRLVAAPMPTYPDFIGLDLAFHELARKDGLPHPDPERREALYSSAYAAFMKEGGSGLVDAVAANTLLQGRIAQAEASGDPVGEILARVDMASHTAATTAASDSRHVVIPHLNDMRLDIAEQVLDYLATTGVDREEDLRLPREAALALYQQMTDAIREGAFEHLGKDESQDVRSSSLQAIVRTAELEHRRGALDELGPVLERMKPIAATFAAKAQAPLAYHRAANLLKFTAVVAFNRGRVDLAIEDACEVVRLRRKIMALDPSTEPRFHLTVAIFGLAQFSAAAGREYISILAEGVDLAATIDHAGFGQPEIIALIEGRYLHAVALLQANEVDRAILALDGVRAFVEATQSKLDPAAFQRGLRNIARQLAEAAHLKGDNDLWLNAGLTAVEHADALYDLTGDEDDAADVMALRSAVVAFLLSGLPAQEAGGQAENAANLVRLAHYVAFKPTSAPISADLPAQRLTIEAHMLRLGCSPIDPAELAGAGATRH